MVIPDLLPLVPFDVGTQSVANLDGLMRGQILMLVPSHPLLIGLQDHPHVIAAHKAYAECVAALEDEILNGDGSDQIGGLL